jgi:MEMO1 family protein
MIRNPVVAGQFYSNSKALLLKEVKSYLGAGGAKEDAVGMVSPHAGYIYSGPVAGSVFSAVKPKDAYILLGPNHTGLGAAFGLATYETWKTPLGDVRLDAELAKKIIDNCDFMEEDLLSHSHEHSIEVQLPFIQATCESFKIVPICVSHAELSAYIEAGKAIAKSVSQLKHEKKAVIVASSDMTHYESAEEAKTKDAAAIDAILRLDEKALAKAVSSLDISMCGYAPTVMMLVAAKELGATRARLVKYQTSGDVSGDYTSVVGYAGIVIS